MEYPEIYNQFFDLIQYGGGTNEQYRNGSHPVAQLKKKIVFDWKRRGGDSRKTKSWANLNERYQVMSIIHQAFMHFVNNKYTKIAWKTDQSTLDEISTLCRKNINIRYSYKELVDELKALGNGIVPAVVAEFLMRICPSKETRTKNRPSLTNALTSEGLKRSKPR